MPRHIVIKLKKLKTEKILKTTTGKKQITYKGIYQGHMVQGQHTKLNHIFPSTNNKQ